MATRYWVGGTGNWDASTTTHWGSASGTADNSSVPTSADDVIFDTASSTANAAYTVTITAAANCANFTMDGPDPADGTKVTWAGSSALNIYGSMSLSGGAAGITRTYTGAISFLSSSTGLTVNTNGVSLSSSLNFNNATGSWRFLNDLTNGYNSVLTVTAGTFSVIDGANSYSYSGGGIAILAGATIYLGSSTHYLNYTSTPWSCVATGNVFCGTSTIKYTENSPTLTSLPQAFAGGGKTYYNLWFDRGNSVNTVSVTGSNTFNEIKDTGTTAHIHNYTEGTTQHVTNFLVSGANVPNAITIRSGNNSATFAIVKDGGGTVTCNYVRVAHSVATPANTWYAESSTNDQALTTAGSGWTFNSLGIFVTDNITISEALGRHDDIVYVTENVNVVIKPPTVTTEAVTSISTSSATANGTITPEGNTIAYAGATWGTSSGPSLNLIDSFTNVGSTLVWGSYAPFYYIEAQSFTATNTNLQAVKFFLKKVGAPTGNIVSRLYAHTGTFGVNGTPTGAALATSDPIDISTLTTSLSEITFNFTGGNQVALTAGTHYFISYEFNGGNPTNHLSTNLNSVTPTHPGNLVEWNGTGWDIYGSSGTSYDLPFILLGTTSSSSSATSSALTGAFTSPMTGLSLGTLYYVKAYVISNNTVTYGNEVSFTTLSTLSLSISDSVTVSENLAFTIITPPVIISVFDSITLSESIVINTSALKVNPYSTSNILVNSGFDTDTDWVYQAGWSISGGKARADGSSAGRTMIYQYCNLLSSTEYTISLDVTYGGTGYLTIGDANVYLVPAPGITATGHYDFVVTTSAGGNGVLYLHVWDNFLGTIDNVTATPGHDSFEYVLVSESVNLKVSAPQVSVYDSVTVSENTNLFITKQFLSVFDSVTVSESNVIFIPKLVPSVFDSVTVSENTTILIPKLVPSVFDSVTVSENTNLFITKQFLSVFDSVTVSENSNIVIQKLVPSVFDSITVSENVSIVVSTKETLFESITVSENVSIRIRAAWYNADSLVINTGSIISGTVEDTWTNNDVNLVLAEVFGNPGFSYDFIFPNIGIHDFINVHFIGRYDEPVTTYGQITTSYSDSATQYNGEHNIKLQQYNFTTTGWDNVTSNTNDFPYSATKILYDFSLFYDVNHVSSGELRLRTLHVSQGDTDGQFILDNIELNTEPNVVLEENIVVTENVSILITKLMPSVFDEVTIQETVFLFLPALYLLVSDNVTVTENTNITNAFLCPTSDNITVSENINLSIPLLYLSTSEDITVSENISNRVSVSINVSDSISITENIASQSFNNINVFDSIVVSENIAILSSTYEDFFELVTVSENVNIKVSTSIDLFDFLLILENVNIQVPLPVNTYDSILVSEAIVTKVNFNNNFFESITVSEDINLKISTQITTSDLISVSDSVDILIPELFIEILEDEIDVSELLEGGIITEIYPEEDITVDEDINIFIENLVLEVYDEVNISENVSLYNPIPLVVSENVTVTDFVFIVERVDDDFFETIWVSEEVTIRISVGISKFDTINITEFTSLSLPLPVSAYDSIALTEGIVIIERLDEDFFELITVSEYINFFVPVPLNIYSTVTVSENAKIESICNLFIIENIVTSEWYAAIRNTFGYDIPENRPQGSSINYILSGEMDNTSYEGSIINNNEFFSGGL